MWYVPSTPRYGSVSKCGRLHECCIQANKAASADEQMANRVGDYLKHDPLKLRFTSSNPPNAAPKQVIKRALNQSVADITQTNYYSSHPNVIVYYEVLDISIIELETKKSLKVHWTGRYNKEEVSYSL